MRNGLLFHALMDVFHSLIATGTITVAVAASVALAPRDWAIAPERWFLPGAIGREAGRVLPRGERPPVQPEAARGVLTRFQSDLAGETEETWARRQRGGAGATQKAPPSVLAKSLEVRRRLRSKNCRFAKLGFASSKRGFA